MKNKTLLGMVSLLLVSTSVYAQDSRTTAVMGPTEQRQSRNIANGGTPLTQSCEGGVCEAVMSSASMHAHERRTHTNLNITQPANNSNSRGTTGSDARPNGE